MSDCLYQSVAENRRKLQAHIHNGPVTNLCVIWPAIENCIRCITEEILWDNKVHINGLKIIILKGQMHHWDNLG